MLQLAGQSRSAAEELWIACSRDPLFYINGFCWTYDPRRETPVVPFLTWGYQDETIMRILEAIRSPHKLLVEKSRDMGASWLILAAFEWLWHFHDYKSFMLLSRKEDLVDKSGDPDSLFWKIDFLHANQPGWLLPVIERAKLHIGNASNGSTIDGESTNGDVGRGGRRTAICADEFASVPNGFEVLSAIADNSDCTIYNSTPKGTGNAFYYVRELGTRRLRLHWTVHPRKAMGLYTGRDGMLQLLDRQNPPAENYPFLLDGKLRSPWYDEQCRGRHPMHVAQELDIDYLASDHQFFEGDVIERVRVRDCRVPMLRGELDYDRAALWPKQFTPSDGGSLKLWCQLDESGFPPGDRKYVIGGDVATGTGASNSVLVVADGRTREQVGEYANAWIKPHELARIAIALARFFRSANGDGAHLIWEANGPGRNFGDAVVEAGYYDIYYRTKDQSVVKKPTDFPGWQSSKEGKLNLLSDFRAAIKEDQFVVRSEELISECLEYVFLPNQSVAHSRSSKSIDPSGANDNHGDRVIGGAVTYLGMKSLGLCGGRSLALEGVSPRYPGFTPPGSLAARWAARDEKKARASW